MPVFVGAGTSAFMKGDGGVGFTRLTTTQRSAITAVEGQVIYNSTLNVLEYYTGSQWSKISPIICVLNTVTGNIADGIATTITLAGEGFLTSNLVVNFVQSADSIDVNVTVTPSSDTAATVTIPASIYNNVTAGRVVTIKATNSDGSESSTVNKTAVALPTGGTITNYSGYRSHKFTSSGTFTATPLISQVDALMVAGGGGGGADNAGGGGAGGMKVHTGINVSAQGYSIVIGGGGTGSTQSHGDGGPYAISGSNTTAFGYSVTGGGRGGSSGGANAASGGSGGGGAQEAASATGAAGTSGQGSAGGNGANGAGGGGGGKGAVGQNGNVRSSAKGGLGGAGAQNNYETGSNQWYAAGGNGGNENGQYDNPGGTNSIGGVSNTNGSVRSSNGAANTGSGGGGGTHTTSASPAGGDGGSGVVVIRYAV